jgi:hypothetical protein
LRAITLSKDYKIENIELPFGSGRSDEMLLEILDYDHFWNTKRQKLFQDLHWKK